MFSFFSGERETSSAGTQHVKKLQRDLGLPAEEFEANQSNCCVHCSQKGYPRPKSRPPSMIYLLSLQQNTKKFYFAMSANCCGLIWEDNNDM